MFTSFAQAHFAKNFLVLKVRRQLEGPIQVDGGHAQVCGGGPEQGLGWDGRAQALPKGLVQRLLEPDAPNLHAVAKEGFDVGIQGHRSAHETIVASAYVMA